MNPAKEVGGLGIYMVKKSMDDVSYEYRNGQNILKIRKNCESGVTIHGGAVGK